MDSQRRGAAGRLFRLLAVVSLMLATLAMVTGPRAGAQESGLVDDNRYVFGLAGTVVEWRGDWDYDPDSSGEDEGVEFAGFLSPTGGLLIGEIQGLGNIDLNQLLAVVLETVAEDADEFVTLDRSATDVVSYSLDAAIIDGLSTGLFTYVQPSPQAGTILFTSILAESSTFAQGIADAQQNITVNGRVALEGIDGSVLAGLLPETVSTPGGNAPDDDEDDPPLRTDDESDEPEDNPEPGGNTDDEDDQEEDEPSTQEDDESATGDLADLGVVEEGLYESPQFGTEVEWNSDWAVTPEFTESNEDDELDSLGLASEDGALVLFTFFAGGDITPEDFAAFWQSDDFLSENASPDVEVLLADADDDQGGVLYVDELEDGGQIVTLRQANSLDGGDTIAIVLMIGSADTFTDQLESAQDGIGLDGDDALSLFSGSDVEDEL